MHLTDVFYIFLLLLPLKSFLYASTIAHANEFITSPPQYQKDDKWEKTFSLQDITQQC